MNDLPEIIGASVPRRDAPDKTRGFARYTEDLIPAASLWAKVLHSSIANGQVRSMDVSAAVALPGVVKVFTCFDVPDLPFPTAGHPWSLEESHQDIADRLLLNKRVRYVGDDIAVVVAINSLIASQALALIKVEYEEYPPLTDMETALAGPPLHPEISPTNMLAEHSYASGDLRRAKSDSSLAHVKKTYRTAALQHCHIEGIPSFAYGEGEKITVVTSTQIPHITRRVIGQALGLPWGQIRVVKPYIGGGFGNKQDVLYEPLNAWVCQQLGGRCVAMDISREEIFTSTRQRHAMDMEFEAWADKEGRLVAREIKIWSRQGAYASHGHAIAANAATYMRDIYQDQEGLAVQAHTVYTTTATAGAMRGYGIPQACFAAECAMEELARGLHMDPALFREKNMMPQGFRDPGTGITCHSYGLAECVSRGKQLFDWEARRAECAIQDGPLRRGCGMAIFTYKTGVYPISLETATARMVLNQDGSIQLQLGATEIGQGGDTVFCQMAAAATGLPYEDIHIVSAQDTDSSPFDTGAYASRQTYVTGKAIKQTGEELRKKILDYASLLLEIPAIALDLRGRTIYKRTINQPIMDLAQLAQRSYYDLQRSHRLSAETTCHCADNTFAFGCTFALVEVDIPLGKVRVLDLLNVHDSGTLINPALARAQVQGGMAMGLGMALGEQLLYDGQGSLLNGNFLDYKLPTAMDVPDFRVAFVETYDKTGPFGNKALGEPPSIPVAPAIRNAVYQATGVAVDELPMTPQRLVALFQERGLI